MGNRLMLSNWIKQYFMFFYFFAVFCGIPEEPGKLCAGETSKKQKNYFQNILDIQCNRKFAPFIIENTLECSCLLTQSSK